MIQHLRNCKNYHYCCSFSSQSCKEVTYSCSSYINKQLTTNLLLTRKSAVGGTASILAPPPGIGKLWSVLKVNHIICDGYTIEKQFRHCCIPDLNSDHSTFNMQQGHTGTLFYTAEKLIFWFYLKQIGLFVAEIRLKTILVFSCP